MNFKGKRDIVDDNLRSLGSGKTSRFMRLGAGKTASLFSSTTSPAGSI